MRKVDAIVAIGGGVSSAGELSASSRTRADMAVALYTQGIAENIILSGKWWHRLSEQPPLTEAAAMREYIIRKGIKSDSLIAEDQSQDTVSNAYFIKESILKVQGWRQIAVVTCKAHAPRMNLIFSHVLGPGYEVLSYPTSEPSSQAYRAREAIGLVAVTGLLEGLEPGDGAALSTRFSYLNDLAAAG